VVSPEIAVGHSAKAELRVRDRATNHDRLRYLIREILNEDHPDAEKIVPVSDNLNTHIAASFYEAFELSRLAEARRPNRVSPQAEARQLAHERLDSAAGPTSWSGFGWPRRVLNPVESITAVHLSADVSARKKTPQ